MKRRTALVSSAAAVAAAAGVGAALWQTRRAESGPSADTDIWPMQFEMPQGGQLALTGWRGQPMLLNFWATWCPPCVSEMPLLDRFYREHRARGWQVVGLAVDNRDPVLAFLGTRPVSFPVGLAGMGGVELTRALGNAGGGLPFSVVFDRTGTAVERKLGAVEPEDLQRWAASLT